MSSFLRRRAAPISLLPFLPLLALAACKNAPPAPPAPSAPAASASAPVIAPDARIPRGLRDDVEAYLTTTGGVRGPHITELTIDPEIQAIADEATARVAESESAREAFVVVVDPKTGAILALSGKRHIAKPGGTGDAWDLAVRTEYEPASVTKTFTVSGALDTGAIRLDQRFGGENGKWKIGGAILRDGEPHGAMTPGDVLAISSNVGAGKIAMALGKPRFGAVFRRFHFGLAPAIELQGAKSGEPRPFDSFSDYQTAAIGSGHGFKLAPLQVAMAFASIANGGVYNEPTLVRSIHDASGRAIARSTAATASPQPSIRPETARTVLGLLEGVVTRPDGTGKLAAIPGCRVAGKTGTGDDAEGFAYGSFVGTFPVDKPRVVIFAGAVGREDMGYLGGKIGAPLFRTVAEKLVAKGGCSGS